MRLSLKVARLVNLVLVGMLTGNEFSGFVAIYPALGRTSPMTRLEAEQAIYRRLGRIMPFYMVSTLASFLPVLILQRRPGSPAFRFTLAGMACYFAMVTITRRGNLPINARIEELPMEEASFEEFRELRERWDRLHAVRNVLNVAGLLFACLCALSEPRATRKTP
ncbi:MAG: DUF1772 domain-containing protein [Rubrobacteraceae bacterium]|nr:DUF1772 domain-containing protein [Rubrobacteraceae bacterium]